jgi:hypothetical protein
MKIIFKIILLIITIGAIIILVDTAMVDSGDEINIINSNSTNSNNDNNVESISPFDVFKDTKDQLESGLYPNKDTLPKCEQNNNIEYAKEGKSCKTSSEQILTCKNGMVSLNNGLKGKTLHLNAFDIILKCKD